MKVRFSREDRYRIGDAKCYSHAHPAVIRVYDEAGDVIEAHEHKGAFILRLKREIIP